MSCTLSAFEGLQLHYPCLCLQSRAGNAILMAEKEKMGGIQSMGARNLRVAVAIGLIASAPAALGQKMYKCPDGKGGMGFQQTPCAETPQELEARKKEEEARKVEFQRQKEEEARKKEEAAQKAKERDAAYQEQLRLREEVDKKNKAAEQGMLGGTSKEKGFDDGSLPAGFDKSHPGAWKEVAHGDITATLSKAKTPGCAQYRYRQRANGLPEYVVQCTTDKKNWVTYFVWPRSDTVKGPAKF